MGALYATMGGAVSIRHSATSTVHTPLRSLPTFLESSSRCASTTATCTPQRSLATGAEARRELYRDHCSHARTRLLPRCAHSRARPYGLAGVPDVHGSRLHL